MTPAIVARSLPHAPLAKTLYVILFSNPPLDLLDQDSEQEDTRQDRRRRQRLLEVVKNDRDGVLDLRKGLVSTARKGD